MADFFENPWVNENSAPSTDIEASNEWSENGIGAYNALFPNAVSVKKTINHDSILIGSRKDITIVIDPGHGNTKGNTGSTFIKAYKHKEKDANGKVVIDTQTKKAKIVETKIQNLPSYVKTEVTTLPKKSWKWATKTIYDNTKLERDLVWDVSLELKSLLSTAGYNVLMTRKTKILNIKGTRATRQKRIDVANKNKAHYFISVHADGSIKFDISGSHAIYRSGSAKGYTKRQKEFADDIFNFFNVVKKKNSPKLRTNIQVLSPSLNNAYRCTLLELGFVTNISDWANMSANKPLMAKQIAKGLEKNIVKIYYTFEEDLANPVGYSFNNKVYKNKLDADNDYNALSLLNPLIEKPKIAYAVKRKKLKAHQY